MLYLIDGYNLLFALALLPKQHAPQALHHARLRLLDLLRSAFGDDATNVTVVFDAAAAPRGASAVQDHRGLEVRFAVHYDEADDLIELLIRRDPRPQRLTVVSDDHRIQKAAKRRKCPVFGCGDLLDWLDRRKHLRERPPQQPPSKPQRSSAADTEHWLQAFGDLDGSPELREAFNPFDFEEPPP